MADAFGYFVPASAASAGRVQLVTPVRLLDTRAAALIGHSGAKPSAGSTASSLNCTTTGQTVANHVIASTSTDGGVNLFTQSGTHLVVDINGWYVA